MRWCLPSNRLTWAEASYTTSACDPQYPFENLYEERPTEVTRFSTAGPIRLAWDWTGTSDYVAPCEGVLIVMHTFPAGTVVKVQGNDTDDWVSPAFSQDIVVPAWPDLLAPNLVADLRGTSMVDPGYRWHSLLLPAHPSFGGSPAPANHALGTVYWVQQWTQPSVSCGWPVRRGELRKVNVNSTSYGVDHVIDRIVRQRRLFPSFTALSDADRQLVLNLMREAGGDRAFPIVLDVDEVNDFAASAEALLVRFHPEAAATFNENLSFFAQTDLALDLVEVQRGLPL